MFDFPRTDTPELLDEADAPWDDVERSLIDLRRINRWLGGISMFQKLVRSLGADVRQSSILDLGTGSSDLLESLPPGRLRVGLDMKIEHLLYGRRAARGNAPPVARVVADALRLPFRDRSVDVVTSAHFLHHFTPEQNRTILEESLRVSRRGVAVNDTKRHLAPLLFVRLISALRLVGPITRFDAPASVRRAYTVAEAREVARSVGATRIGTIHSFPFRFGLLLWK